MNPRDIAGNAKEEEDEGQRPRDGCQLSTVEPISDLKIATLVTALPGTLHETFRSVLGLVGLVSVYGDWIDSTLDLQLLSECGSRYGCLCRSGPDVHFARCWNVKLLKNKQAKKLASSFCVCLAEM